MQSKKSTFLPWEHKYRKSSPLHTVPTKQAWASSRWRLSEVLIREIWGRTQEGPLFTNVPGVSDASLWSQFWDILTYSHRNQGQIIPSCLKTSLDHWGPYTQLPCYQLIIAHQTSLKRSLKVSEGEHSKWRILKLELHLPDGKSTHGKKGHT